jgi:polar amino acid transport system permease protein
MVVEISQLEQERRKYRKLKKYKSVFISLVSVIIFVTIIVFWLGNTEGWKIVQQTFFDPETFIESIPPVFLGLLVNIGILVFAAIGVAILATLLALMRTVKSPVLFPLKVISTIYTDIFRGVPLIIVLYLIGFGIPALGIFGRIPPVVLGTIAIVIVYSAYVSEVIRSGIESIHPSQRDAARSLGLSHGKTLTRIILPQGIRKVIPALMNDFVAMQKDVGLCSVLGVVDAVRRAQILNALDFNYTHYVVAALMFVILGFPFIHLTNWYAKKVKDREEKGGMV